MTARPLHRQPRALALVLIGGLLGTPARYAVTLALPTHSGRWPTSTFLVNLLGAFALGFLLESLVRRGDDSGVRQRVRLLLGTGFMGAFTTYSTLALDTDLLARDHHDGLALGYALASLVLGAAATVAGLATAGRTTRALPTDPDLA